MRKLLSVSLLSLLSLSSFCQHTQITISDDFKIAEKEYKDQTVTHSVYHNNYFYTATNSGINGKWLFTKLYDVQYAVTISKFDKGMNKVKEFELANGEKQYGPLEPQLILLNNKLCLVYFQSDNKSSFNLYMSLIDENDLTPKEPKRICNIVQENIGIFKLESFVRDGIIYFAHSTDNTKTLIACKASVNTILTFIIDNDLNIVKQAVSHTTTDGFNISGAVLTNDDVACLVISSDQEKKLVCVDGSGRKTEMKLTGSGALSPYNTNATLSKDGKSIYVYSTTSLGHDDKNCNGLLLSQLDIATLRLSKQLAYEFTPEMIESIYQKGGGTKHKKEYFMNNFIPHLMELDNGNVVILGSPEDLSTSTSSYMAPSSSFNSNSPMQMKEVVTTTFDIGPVMSFFLNKAGKTFDYAIIPRKISLSRMVMSGMGAVHVVQAPGVSRSYSNFTATNLGDEIAIVYDDDEKNLTKSEDEKIAEAHSTNDLVLAEALIGKDKKMDYRKQIGKNVSGRYTYFLGTTIPTSSSSIIFPIAKEGFNFNARKIFYSNWCFLDIK